MMDWIAENAATVLVGLAVLLMILGAILMTIRSKKKGKGSCGYGCESCPMHESCKKKEKK